MRWATVCMLLVVLLADHALAQPAPFDMSPERTPETESEAETESAPETPEAPLEQDGAGTEPETAPAAEEAAPTQRFLLPFERVVLSGEREVRRWVVDLTGEQTAANVLNLAYQNAVVVAPEASRLRLDVNGRTLIDEPIRSADRIRELRVDVPPGLLVAGDNTVTLRAEQRHRTDCSIASTYELWSSIDPANTYLSIPADASVGADAVAGLSAIGVDGTGASRVDILAPDAATSAIGPQVLRLAQAIALHARLPNLSFKIRTEMAEGFAGAQMRVLLGTVEDIRALGLSVPADALRAGEPRIVFLPDIGPTLLVIGETDEAIASAVGRIASPVDNPASFDATSLETETWAAPNAPMLFEEGSIRFSDLGVGTSQFAGRRFSTSFRLGMPSDFYAPAYGEMRILLDAAYSAEVRPGSHIDIYVNDNIASTMPITTERGGVFRHQPISVTMRHLKPGINEIRLEANLLTASDAECTPGAASKDTPRFALFDSTELRVPDFARIGQRPNLAAWAGRGFPYNRAEAPLPLVLGSQDMAVYSAAATLLGKVASASGRLIPLEFATTQASVGERDALFIGSASQMPPGVLAQVGVAEAARSDWTGGASNGDVPPPSTEETFQQWRDAFSNNFLLNWLTAFEGWLQSSYNISVSALRLAPPEDGEFVPGDAQAILIAQDANPGQTASWTVVAAPTPDMLESGAASLARRENWNAVSGHLSFLEADAGTVSAMPVGAHELIPTRPFSLANMRLVATNWLSSNVLSYSVLLVILCAVLGVATAGLLARLGRR